MTDARTLLEYPDAREHMGGLIVHSALQGSSHAATVAPRVAQITEAWPDADTTTGFRKRIVGDDLSSGAWLGGLGRVIDWTSWPRLVQMAATAQIFSDRDIDTTGDLRARLEDSETRIQLQRDLGRVRGIGPATLDCLDILSGVTASAAIGDGRRSAA